MITHSTTKSTSKITKSIAIVKKKKQKNHHNQNELNLDVTSQKKNERINLRDKRVKHQNYPREATVRTSANH